MSESTQQEAMDLEKDLISPEDWHTAPKGVRLLAEDAKSSGSTGIGKCYMGWFVLGTGQGPFIIWREWEEQTIPCMFCSDPTRMIGTAMCDGCYEVDKRIDNFVEAGGVRAFERLAEAVKRTKNKDLGKYLVKLITDWM